MPPDWTLPEDWKRWAMAEQPTWTSSHADKVGANFRDYWLGAPKGTKLDWLATWRGWVRREGSMAGQPKGAAHSETKAQQQIAEQRRAAERAAPMPDALRAFVPKREALPS